MLSEEAGQVLVQIDSTTEQAVRTISLPDDYTWKGITFVDDELLLLGGRFSDQTGVIRRVDF